MGHDYMNDRFQRTDAERQSSSAEPLDYAPLVESVDQSEATNKPSNRLRWFELVLVLVVAFGNALAVSIFTVLTRTTSLYSGSSFSSLGFVGVIQEIPPLALLVYVLLRQGRTLKDLGLRFKWTDLPFSFLLFFCAVVVELILWQVFARTWLAVSGHIPDTTQRNIEFVTAGLSVWTLILILINPVFEELIVRAYLITEVGSLTGSAVVAVAVSVVLQTSYHLYQGVVPAILYSALFLVFSIYYVKTRRILPVILAHFYFDFMAVAYYALR
jgi:membrane protease YdiL (CAAX protease family)